MAGDNDCELQSRLELQREDECKTKEGTRSVTPVNVLQPKKVSVTLLAGKVEGVGMDNLEMLYDRGRIH